MIEAPLLVYMYMDILLNGSHSLKRPSLPDRNHTKGVLPLPKKSTPQWTLVEVMNVLLQVPHPTYTVVTVSSETRTEGLSNIVYNFMELHAYYRLIGGYSTARELSSRKQIRLADKNLERNTHKSFCINCYHVTVSSETQAFESLSNSWADNDGGNTSTKTYVQKSSLLQL